MSSLLVDVFLAQPISTVPPAPLPNNVPSLWTPTTSTLIHSAHEAILVDPLTTKIQSKELADWVADTIPGKKLKYIYVTHGHGDHFFGIPGILEKFPSALPIATKGVLKHMNEQITEGWPLWNTWFPGDQLEKPDLSKVQTLDDGHQKGEFPTIRIDDHILHSVPVGHSDTNDTTVLWSPELNLVVAGDAVYNGAFQYIVESTTVDQRNHWIQAVEKIKALRPTSVVTGHKRPNAIDGAWTLDWTQQYLRSWDETTRMVKKEGGSAEVMFQKMRQLYPDNVGNLILWISSLAEFPPPAK